MTHISHLIVLQETAVRFICHSKYICHSDPIIKALYTLKVADLHMIALYFYNRVLFPKAFLYSFALSLFHLNHNDYDTYSSSNSM